MSQQRYNPHTAVVMPGEVLLDNTTLTQAGVALNRTTGNIEEGLSLAQLVEAIVLHEGIRVDAETMHHGWWFNDLHGGGEGNWQYGAELSLRLNHLIRGVSLSSELTDALVLLVKQSIREADLPQIYSNADRIDPGFARRVRIEGLRLFERFEFPFDLHRDTLQNSTLVVAARTM